MILFKNSEGFLTAERLDEIFNPGRQKEIDIEFWDQVIKEFDQSGNGMVLSYFDRLFIFTSS